MNCHICHSELQNGEMNSCYPITTDKEKKCCDSCYEKFIYQYRMNGIERQLIGKFGDNWNIEDFKTMIR